MIVQGFQDWKLILSASAAALELLGEFIFENFGIAIESNIIKFALA